jgi:GNAT superfamily N-acetyltransferase
MVTITSAALADAEEILALQKLAYQSEARLYDDWSIPPLTQTLESLKEEFATSLVLKAVSGPRIVGSVRANAAGERCTIGRLIVDPEFQRRGIGARLLQRVEAECGNASKFELFTGTKSEANVRLYQRHGYSVARTEQLSPSVMIVFMEKAGPANL